ncbi:MAG: hypothetical protein ABI175_21635 [Polyangiales bacterium]
MMAARTPMTLRRLLLVTAVVGLGALATRRAHANRDPSELSVGGSLGSHDAHFACAPDVRVRHASGGFVYRRTFEEQGGDKGEGPVIDARAGFGITAITEVDQRGIDATTKQPNNAQQLYDNEHDRGHFLATAQVSGGWDWGVIAVQGGLGYFGMADTADDRTFRARYYPLPVLEARFGKKKGFSLDTGLGAAPLPGLTRWYSGYAIGQYRFKEGGEIGAGVLGVPASQLDRRAGVLFKGSFPVTPWLSLGGFGLVDANDKSHLGTLNWTAGGTVTFLLDGLE